MCRGLAVVTEKIGDEWKVYALEKETSHDKLLTTLDDELRYGRRPHIKFEVLYPDQIRDDIQLDIAESYYPTGWVIKRGYKYRACLEAFAAVSQYIYSIENLEAWFTPQMYQNADLRSADLQSANLRSANLRSADLWNADLRSANLRSADLWNADLRSADLRSADLRSADLQSANLRSADLRSADLRSADLRSANLRSADLRSADLRSADLRSANLQSANLRSADLWNADLRSADLRSARNKDKAIGLQEEVSQDG